MAPSETIAKKDGAAATFVVVSLVATALLFYAVAKLLPAPNVEEIRAKVLAGFLVEVRDSVRPEPQEKRLYQIGIAMGVLVPIAIYAGLDAISRQYRGSAELLASRPVTIARNVFVIGITAAWLLKNAHASEIPAALTRCLAAAVLAVPIALSTRTKIPHWARIRPVLLAALTVIAFRLVYCSESRIVSDEFVAHHIDLLFGAVNQVAHGRTILVDTSSQYGIAYPYIVAALVEPFGSSAAAICVTFTLLGIASLAFVYLTIHRAARALSGTPCVELLFLGFAGISVSFFVCNIFKVSWIYYQYFPLRVVFGCFFFWYIGRYARTAEGGKKRLLLVLGYALAGLAVLWNTDTGVVIAAAWTAAAAFDEARARDVGFAPAAQQVLRALVRHVILLSLTLATTLGLYAAFAWLRSGHFPNFAESLRFQQVFYGSGFYMLPMHAWDLWQPVAAAYVVAILACFRSWLARGTDAGSTEKLFIALFGLGIFSYYQGRSHAGSLFAVSYPAALLGCLFFLDLLNEDPAGRAARPSGEAQIAAGLALFLPALGLATLVAALPRVGTELSRPPPMTPLDPDLAAALAAVGQSRRGEELPVVSQMENYIHLKTGTASPFPVSSMNEVFLLDQVEELRQTMRKRSIHRLLVHGPSPVAARYLDAELRPFDLWARE